MQTTESFMIPSSEPAFLIGRHGCLLPRWLATSGMCAEVKNAYADLKRQSILRYENEEYKVSCSLETAFEFAADVGNESLRRAIVNVCLEAALIDLGKHELGKTIAKVISSSLNVGTSVSAIASLLIYTLLEEVNNGR